MLEETVMNVDVIMACAVKYNKLQFSAFTDVFKSASEKNVGLLPPH